MLDFDAIAGAVAHHDRLEEQGATMDQVVAGYGIAKEGLERVASLRALRTMSIVLYGEQGRLQTIRDIAKLNPEQQRIFQALGTCWIDGFLAAERARQVEDKEPPN